MKKTLSLAIAALSLAAIIAPTTAFAAETAEVSTSTTDAITWVEVAVPAGDHAKVSVKIFNVEDGSKALWQRCGFSFTGAGTYRCGIDSDAGSMAAEQDGSWVAKAFVDGRQVARQTFSL